MLEVKHLRRVYKVKKGASVYALDDVSLKFPETGLVFILGKSGSGKSTLLNVMGGLDTADDGEIIINGKSSKQFSKNEMDSYRNTYLGFIFQEYNILNDFTVKENIGLALQLQHKKATDEAINKILDEVDLSGYGNRKPNELSGGQKQRVAIARALVKEPNIIFGDEPTGALDSNTGRQVFETLKKLSKDKLVVIVSHDRDFAEHFGDRVIELKDGKIISDITKKSVECEQTSPGVSILGDNIIKIDKGHLLTYEDLEIINTTLGTSSEDVFISADSHVNDALCEAARIDKSGNRQTFFTTDNDSIKEGNASFKPIKSSFSLFNALKMGVKSLRVKPFRLIMTIFLSAIAFGLFGLSLTASMFNTPTAMLQTAQHFDIHHTGLSVSQYNNNNYRNDLSDENKKYIEDNFDATIYKLNYSESSIMDYIPLSNSTNVEKLSYGYYTTAFQYTLPTNQSVLDKLNITLVQGRLPANENECMVPVHLLNTFIDYGYKNGTVEYSANDAIFNETFLIGKPLRYNDYHGGNKNMTIVGTVDTKLPERFNSLRTLDHRPSYGEDAYNLMEEKNNRLDERVLFTYLSDAKEETQYISRTSIPLSSQTSDGSQSQETWYYKFGYFQNLNNTLFFDSNKTTLSKNEVLIDYNSFINYLLNISNKNVDYDLQYTLEGSYTEVINGQGNYPITIQLSDGGIDHNVNTRIPEAAIRRIAYDHYLDFKDNEYFKIIYENERPEEFDYYSDNYYYYQYDTNTYNYPWKNNPSYVLTDEDKTTIYYATYFYLNQIYYRGHLNKPYYHDILEQIDTYKKGFFEATNYDDLESINELQNYFNVALDTYIQNHLSEFVAQFKDNPIFISYKANYSGYSDYDANRNVMRDLLSSESYSVEPFFSDFRSSYKNGIKQLIKENFELKNYILTSPNEYKLEYRHTFTVVGINFDVDDSQLITLSKADALQLQEEFHDYDYSSYYLICLPTDENKLIALFKDIAEKEAVYRDWENRPSSFFVYSLVDRNIQNVSSISSLLTMLMQVFLYVGIGLAVFSVFLFYNFISISINNKKREIGILRAVGAKRSDVFKIFYSESFIISFINFLIAAAGIIALSIVMNINFRGGERQLFFNIMNPTPIVFVIVFGISLITSIFSALIPVTRLANKKPIDAIQNR